MPADVTVGLRCPVRLAGQWILFERGGCAARRIGGLYGQIGREIGRIRHGQLGAVAEFDLAFTGWPMLRSAQARTAAALASACANA
jgi:hypothetical protein